MSSSPAAGAELQRSRVFAMMVALCPALAVSTHLIHAVVFSLATAVVLIGASIFLTAVRGVFSGESRSVAGFIVIATLVSVLDLLLQAYLPWISAELGMYVPLIAVSCIVISRTRIDHDTVASATLDALSAGLTFAAALIMVATLREAIGLGTLTLLPFAGFDGVVVLPLVSQSPLRMLALAPGAFLVVGYLLGFHNWARERLTRRLERAESVSAAEGAPQ